MKPAKQRLHAHHPLLIQADDGLIFEEQLILIQGLVQLILHNHANRHDLVGFRTVELVIVFPFLLGQIHRGVSVFEEFLDLLAVIGIHADADAG